MKLLKIFFPLLLLSSLSLPFILKGSDGKPVMDVDGLFSGEAGKGFSLPGGSANGGSNKPKATNYYRWQDANGQWHFSDKADPQSQKRGKVEQVSMNNQVNLMEGIDVPKEQSGSAGGEPKRRSIPFPTTVDPRDIPKLIEDAKNVQNLVDQRTQELDQY